MAQATCYLRLAAEGGDGRRRRRDRSHPDAPRPQARAKQPAITHQSATDFSKQDALIVKRIEPRYGPNRTARAGKPVREAASKGGKHEIWPGPSRAAEDGGSSRRRSCWTDGGSRWREWAYRRRRFSGEFPRRRRRLIKRRSAVWVLVWGWGCGWLVGAGLQVEKRRRRDCDPPTRQVPLARPGVVSGERVSEGPDLDWVHHKPALFVFELSSDKQLLCRKKHASL
jgi:hypothetical protein